MKGQTYVILGIIVIIIVSVFAVTNVEPVQVNYLFWSGESPLILVILFSVLMGGLITAAVGSIRIIHLQRENKSLKLERDQFRDLLEEHQLLDQVENKQEVVGEQSSEKEG
ncbi:MAG TPA: lipopolysaccharide assembly protein LapA domain-containing protein [Candidatus Dormibacteraeota bacterium]|nr:lipopolysaccharide assembly protein LapA domain-containing protein [Candidatus Dormibacteraeota bacterium]